MGIEVLTMYELISDNRSLKGWTVYPMRAWKVFLSFVSCQQDKTHCKKRKTILRQGKVECVI